MTMPAKKRHDGKTSVWLHTSTQNALEPFLQGTDTWDSFILRMTDELYVKKRAVPGVQYKTEFEKNDKRTTMWLNKTTFSRIHGLRRGGETWGVFFERMHANILVAGIERNPN